MYHIRKKENHGKRGNTPKCDEVTHDVIAGAETRSIPRIPPKRSSIGNTQGNRKNDTGNSSIYLNAGGTYPRKNCILRRYDRYERVLDGAINDRQSVSRASKLTSHGKRWYMTKYPIHKGGIRTSDDSILTKWRETCEKCSDSNYLCTQF